MDFSGRFQKAVFTMQREVANENAFEYFEPTTSRSKRSLDSSGPLYTSYTRRRTLAEKLGDMQKIIEIAVNGTDTEFARSIFAKSLFVYIKARRFVVWLGNLHRINNQGKGKRVEGQRGK